MIVKNMQELERMLMKQAKKAMKVVASKVEADLYEETAGFYTGGEPSMYQRTGALGDTPKVTAIEQSGREISFNALLDTSHRYTTGKQPSMSAVLAVANDHGLASSYVLRPPVGSQHFWDRALDRMEDTFNSTMRSFFDN